MTLARVVRLTHAEAMRVGCRLGADIARDGADLDEAVAVVSARLFWRLQEAEVRRAFEETERRAG